MSSALRRTGIAHTNGNPNVALKERRRAERAYINIARVRDSSE